VQTGPAEGSNALDVLGFDIGIAEPRDSLSGLPGLKQPARSADQHNAAQHDEHRRTRFS
jgi:hypothetical protein